jgi:F-type H+-transporting ATPase subunit epsilon
VRLVITTPTTIVLDVSSVKSVRAEDATGSFGIMAGHADFLTVLGVSVLIWRDGDGREHCVALRGGVLRVRDGDIVEIATREAIVCERLGHLREHVLMEMTRNTEAEKAARRGALSLEQSVIRHLYGYIRPTERAPRKRERPWTVDGES